MSDAPVSWTPPPGAEPVVGRDGEPITGREGEPIFAGGWPDPPAGAPVSYHYEPHFYSDQRLDAVMAEIAGLRSLLVSSINRLDKAGAHAMVAFTDLMSAVERNTSVIGSVVSYVDAQKAMVAELQTALDAVRERLDNGSDAEIQGVIDQMNAASDRAVAAIAANTPEPAPAPVEPAPEPAPAPAEPVAEIPVQPAPDAPPPAEQPEPDAPAPAPTA